MNDGRPDKLAAKGSLSAARTSHDDRTACLGDRSVLEATAQFTEDPLATEERFPL